MVKIGQELELKVDKFAELGKSICLLDNFVIFVEGAIPGELVKVRIQKIKKKYAEGKVLSVLEKSPLRIEPRCIHFGVCGGCKWQHLPYEMQLQIKRQTVADAVSHIGGFKDVPIANTIPSPKIFNYRHKMEFSFSDRAWVFNEATFVGQSLDVPLALGLHAPSQFSSVVDIKECHLQRTPCSKIVNSIREICLQNGWKPWNFKQNKGYLKHLVIKTAENTTDTMVNLVTESYNSERLKIFSRLIQEQFPDVTTFVNSVLPENSQDLSKANVEVLYGKGIIHERIANYLFEIKPNAFFQPNVLQAESLYKLALEYAQPVGDEVVYDLYCGVGTFSLFFSPHVKKVIGIDVDKEAIESAYNNARSNNISNCEFYGGDVVRLLTQEFIEQHGKPDIIIVDPPRAGLHKKLVHFIKRLKPSVFVYVSCNPMTQMRDLALLKDCYRIEIVQPLDMFPQTYHVESIVKLKYSHIP